MTTSSKLTGAGLTIDGFVPVTVENFARAESDTYFRAAAFYESVFVDRNDGTTVHRLTVRDVPVDGFWSLSVYNSDGYLAKNAENLYSVNNISATADDDASVTV